MPNLFKDIIKRVIRWQYGRISFYLSDSEPEKLMEDGRKKLFEAFRNAADIIPFYQTYLKKNQVNPADITTIEAFERHVPIVNKEIIFSNTFLKDICANGSLEDVCLVYSSSGSSSGAFSFGMETWRNRSRIAMGLEFMLDNAFQIFKQKTFIINCLPMGVKIFTRTLPIAETSVREDVVLALLMKLKDEFDQFIIIGESLFLKKVFEDGEAMGIPWEKIKVNVITGGEYVSESFRSYLASLLHIDFDDPESGIIAVNMGLSELSLSIFSECPETIRIRRAAGRDREFRNALMGGDVSYPPLIMQYYPSQTWLENIMDADGNPRLIVSLLDKKVKIPLMRYDTEDIVQLYSYPEMVKILKESGHADMIPRFKLPFGIITGKRLDIKNSRGSTLSVCEVKEVLFQNFTLSRKITGNFKLSLSPDQHFVVTLQLLKGVINQAEIEASYLSEFQKQTDQKIQIKPVPYLEYGYGIEHNFERKNQYV